MSTLAYVNSETITQVDGAQSSRVPVPLPDDPYVAVRQAHLVDIDTESDPEEAPLEVEELQSLGSRVPLMGKEFEAFKPIGIRTNSSRSSASSDSTTPLSPDHPLTHVSPTPTPTHALFHRRTARMTVRAQPAMSPGLSANVTEVMALSDSAFRKRYRSSYETPSPSLPLPVRKRCRGTSEIILDTDSKGDELGDEDTDEDGKDESLDADDGRERERDDEGCSLEGEGLSLEEEEAVLEGQKQVVPTADTDVSEPLGLGYGVLRHRELAVEEDRVPSTFEVGQSSRSMPEQKGADRVFVFRQPTLTTWVDPDDGRVYTDIQVYVPPAAPVQTLPSPDWSSGSLHISPSSSVVPSPIASPVATPIATILVDEDQFLEVGAQLELHRSILHDHTQNLDVLPPTMFADIDRDVRELYTRSGVVRDEIFLQRYRFRSLEREQERTAVMFGALWRPVLALEAWTGRVDTRLADMSHDRLEQVKILMMSKVLEFCCYVEVISTPAYVDSESITQANGAQSSRVPVPLLDDPYVAVRQAQLVDTDIESDPEEAPSEVEELQSLGSRIPLMDEEFEAFEPIGTRTDSSYSSASSDSITPLSPDHPLTHVSPTPTPTRASFHRRKARMTVRAQLAMSPGLSASVTEAMALSDSAFSKRYRSSYETPSPYPTLPVQKRYRGTSELILDTDSEGDELGDEDTDKDGEDESSNADDERERLDDEGHGLDDEGHGLDDEGHGLDDEGHGLDDKDRALEGKGLGLEEEEEEVVPKGQQQVVPAADTAISEPLGLGYRALRRRELTVDEDRVFGRRWYILLFADIDRDVRELYTRPGVVRALWRPVLALEAWVGRVDTRLVDMLQDRYDDHRLIHDMLVQQAAMQRKLQEVRGHVTALKQEQ
ncbi:hypothetical protein Tco_1548549 [Tanacetum coccineum]